MLFHHKVNGDLDFGWIEIGLTQKLVGPCAAAGVPLLDTFVVSNGCWVSLRKKSPRLFEPGER
jgi:DNA repair protein RadC